MTTVPPSFLTLDLSSSDEHPNGETLASTRLILFMQSLDIQGFSYEERHGLLPVLASAFADCGGWILDRRTLSPSTMEFQIEIQLRAALDLYSSIISTGLQLTRDAHLGLTQLCTCRRNFTSTSDLGQVVSIRFEISFLEDITLQAIFLAACVNA